MILFVNMIEFQKACPLPDSGIKPEMNIYEKFGVPTLINATGTVTRLGGSLMEEAVLDAMKEASRFSVSIEELQNAASRIISNKTGTEAGIVTSGASAGLTLGTASLIAGMNLEKISRIPALPDIPEILVAHNQRNSYDRAITLAGAKLVNVGIDDIHSGAGVRGVELWEYGLEKTEYCVGVLYTLGDRFNEKELTSVVKWAHQNDLAVLVDAAASLPPYENLKGIPETGADLVFYSGGKAIGGPQSTGILCGKKHLVSSALLQMLDWDEHYNLWDPVEGLLDKQQIHALPRHGIGRGMKVSKEAIIGLLKALELFTPESIEKKRSRFLSQLNQIRENLESFVAQAELMEPENDYPVLNLYLNTDKEAANALQLCARLRSGNPRVFVGHGRLKENILQINPVCMREGDEKEVIRRIKEELEG